MSSIPRRLTRRAIGRGGLHAYAFSTRGMLHAKSHLKCPIAQTLAKSNEKWTSNLRTYNNIFNHGVHSRIPCPLTTPPPAVMHSFSLDVHTDFSHVRVHFSEGLTTDGFGSGCLTLPP